MLDMTDRGTMAATLPNGGVVAEVGVQHGDFADMIVRFNKPRKLYLIDCWETQSVADYGHDPANVAQTQQDENERTTRERFKDHANVEIIKGYSVEVAETFQDESLDWVYLDANHLRIRSDLEAWIPKVKPGGWVTGHDYCIFDDFIMVQPVLDRFVEEYGAQLHVVTNEDFPSWAFRKHGHK